MKRSFTFQPLEEISSSSFLTLEVLSYGFADEFLECVLVDVIAFVDVDGTSDCSG